MLYQLSHFRSMTASGWWCREADLNCRHRDFQSRALPAELSRPAGPAGRPRPSASEKVPRVASSRKNGRLGEGVSAGPVPRLSTPAIIQCRPSPCAAARRGRLMHGPRGSGTRRSSRVLLPIRWSLLGRVSMHGANTGRAGQRSVGNGARRLGRRHGAPGPRPRSRQRAQSSPVSSAWTVGASGISPLRALSRLIRSTIGGWVEKSPFERSSNFLIGFVK